MMASFPGTLLPNPGDRSGYAAARKHQMHGIHAVRRVSGNKDPSSRKAPRVFFIGDTGRHVPACRLSGGLTAPLLHHPHVPLDVRSVGAAVHPDDVLLGCLALLLDGLPGHRRAVLGAVIRAPVLVAGARGAAGDQYQDDKGRQLHRFLRIDRNRRYRIGRGFPAGNARTRELDKAMHRR